MPITLSGNGTITGVVAGGLPNNIITANNIIDGSVGLTMTNSTQTSILTFPNTADYPNVSTASFTLTAAQAPIGSYVLMGVNIYSGNSSGNQYCYLYQGNNSLNRLGGFVEDWYYYSMVQGFFAINSAADRSFSVSHATIVATNTGDSRQIVYYGFIKPTP